MLRPLDQLLKNCYLILKHRLASNEISSFQAWTCAKTIISGHCIEGHSVSFCYQDNELDLANIFLTH